MKTLAIVLCLALTGCGASYFACTTKASYDPATGAFQYESCKDQQNFHAKMSQGEDGKPIAEVSTTATTPEAAIAAAMQSLAKLLDTLGPLIEKGLAAAAKVP